MINAQTTLRFSAEFRSELQSLLRTRRTTRAFRSAPMAEHIVEDLLDAMSLAPSVGNSQPWRIVRLQNEEQKRAVFEMFDAANATARLSYREDERDDYDRLNLSGFKGAAVHLAVFTETAPAAGRGVGRMTITDAVGHSTICAMYTLWLVAHAAGVGVSWTTIFEPAAMENYFKVPKTWRFTALLGLGWPLRTTEELVPEIEATGWQARGAGRSG